MKGKILDYNPQESRGLISADDGNRYYFINSEWKSDKAPKIGRTVDFEIDGENAVRVYAESTIIADMDIESKLSDIGLNKENIEAKLTDIGLDGEGIKSKVASLKANQGKLEEKLLSSKWLQRIREETRNVLIYGVANKTGLIVSFFVFLVVFSQTSINSIMESTILNILSFFLMVLIFMLAGMFAYGEKKRTLWKVFGVFFALFVINTILVLVFAYNDYEIQMQFFPIHMFTSEPSYFSPLGDVSTMFFVIGILMLQFVGPSVVLYFNAAVLSVLIPVSIISLLVAIYIYLPIEKKLRISPLVKSNKKQIPWLKIFIVLLTLLFGFIGTFVTRYIMAGKPLDESLKPTGAHFAISFLALIPYVGVLLFFGGLAYMAYLNIQAVKKMIEDNRELIE